MYQEHFGLTRSPFKITPDTSLFFEGNKRGAALDALIYAINSGEGIIKVVGEVGSGKTMLCRMLEVRLSDDIDVIYIANPSLSPDNILHGIAHEMHLDVNNEMSKVDVMQRIQAHLLKKHADNRQVVLFVEEAQSMPIETMEEIRLLSNLETDQHKLLQMVLFGQPELDVKLSQPHIRQLKERITHSFSLTPFPPDDTLQYLNFRLRAVGYKGPDIFNKKTAGAVKKYSNGLTRRINILADKAMLAAFSEGSHSVTPGHVRYAAQDSEFKKSLNYRKIVMLSAAVLSLAVMLFAGIYIGRQEPVKSNVIQDDPATAMPKVEPPAPATGIAEPVVKETKIIPARINQRLEKTRNWLSRVADNNYSIQLFMAHASDADKVEAFLDHVPETLDFTKIYIYETVINGRSWYSVLYNNFATQDEAIEKLDELPASLKASDPYLRRISAIKKDAAQ
jgi:MSHA biogenesis protein MshM